jgi:SIR2-like protein/CHAT domain-containing protein
MPLKVPASLVRHLNEKRCVIFVGAGLSAQAQLPSWSKLLDQLVTQVGADDQDEDSTAELKKLLDAGRYLDVADECKEQLGAGYAEFLSKALQIGTGPVPEAHRLVMQLPFAAWITTNYDKLLEQAHFQVRGSVPKTLTHLDADTFGTLLFDGAPFILKAHGDVDKPESLIFTTRDYREIIHSNPAFQAVFSAILLTRAVLFVGYSLNDPDFRLLLDRQLTTFKKFVPERYAIMSGVGEVEREVLRRTAQIKVISYPAGQHEQLVEFLRALQAQVTDRTTGSGAPATATREAAKVEVGREKEKDDAPSAGPLPGEFLGGGGGRSGAPIPPPQVRPAAPPPRPQFTCAPAAPPAPGAGRRVGPPPAAAAPLVRIEEEAADSPSAGRRDALDPTSKASPRSATRDLASEASLESVALSNAPAGGVVAPQAKEQLALSLSSSGPGIVAMLEDSEGMTAMGTGPALASTGLLKALRQTRLAQDYRALGTLLAEHLHVRVRQALAQHAGAGATSLTLKLDSDLEALPWELLDVGGKPLALQAAVSRAPVGLSSAARGRPMFHKPVRALLIGDPTEELPGVREEIERLSALYPAATVLMGRDATLDAVTRQLSGDTWFQVVHFAGHAWYDAQECYLVLAGGTHLTDDLIRSGISHRPPCVVFMNSHYTAFVPPGVSAKGAEPMKATAAGRIGFTEVAMHAGVGVFVGCFGSPTDAGAKAVALEFHQALLAGAPAAEAIYRARIQVQLPPVDATPLLYALSGYGEMALE